jgi:hypothetical protein
MIVIVSDNPRQQVSWNCSVCSDVSDLVTMMLHNNPPQKLSVLKQLLVVACALGDTGGRAKQVSWTQLEKLCSKYFSSSWTKRLVKTCCHGDGEAPGCMQAATHGLFPPTIRTDPCHVHLILGQTSHRPSRVKDGKMQPASLVERATKSHGKVWTQDRVASTPACRRAQG